MMRVAFALCFMMLLALPVLAQSTVDNCCQVNRSCTTDGDWTQGWFDYQAGQCPATAPAGTTPPAPAADVDNCCQIGRACQTDAEWIQGYNDYQAGQCGGGIGPAPTSSVSSANHYSFSGTDRSATRAFTLTRGKWRFNPNLGRNADTFLVQVTSPGQANPSGTCLTFPSNLHWRGESGAGLRLGAYTHEFAVRYQCDAQFVVFPEVSAGDVQGQRWTININKTDGNI